MSNLETPGSAPLDVAAMRRGASRSERRRQRRSCARPSIATGRAHHLIDIENLFGEHHTAVFEPWFGELYAEVVALGCSDLCSVAADRSHLLEVAEVFPGAQRLVGVGPDGADIALLDAIDWPTLHRGCDTLDIASGDGRFVDAAYRARALELRVVVVSRATSLSRVLASYADEVIEFPDIDPTLPPHLARAA